MNSLQNFFKTDWENLTGYDWTGIVMVLVISALMFTVYFWTYRPSNKAKFEKHRNFVLEDNLKERKHHG